MKDDLVNKSGDLVKDLVNDCISRQAAIRWVKTECNPYGKPTLDFESGKKVIEHLEQMPSAQPGWIPCSERLPKYGEVVLWCNQQGSVFTSAITWQRGNDYGVGQHYGVTAWMPLPTPYREGRNDEISGSD